MDSPFFRTIEVSDPRFERDGLRHVTVKSPALKARADITLFVPRMAEAHRTLPLVILLHGVYGSHWAWAMQGGAHRTAAGMIDRGEIPPMVLAMPSDGLWGDGSGYLRHAQQDFEGWIADEVPFAVRAVVPQVTADSRCFLAGLSMGGFGALRIGVRRGDRFLGVSGHSSITDIDQFAAFMGEDLSLKAAAPVDGSVLRAILESRDRLPALRFDCGVDDQLIEANRELHLRLVEHAIPHAYEEFPGAHEWPYWEQHLADSLRFFATVLVR